jgi:hypothetical protein
MKHTTLLLSASIVLLLVVNVVNVPGEAASPPQQAVVYFAEPIAVEIALKEAAHYGLRVLMLQHSIPIMEQEIQGGYYPEPTISPEEHAKRYEHILTESMSLLVEDAKELLAYEGDKLLQDALQRHIAALELAQVHLQEYGLRIVSMVIQGEADSIGEFATDSSLDKEVELVPFPEVESFKQDQATWVNPSTWLPNRGRTIVRPGNSQDTERYVHQTMIWTDVSGFGPNSTYEHDFFLNNYDGKTYLSRAQGLNGIPTVIYWGSNLPRAYLDTRFSDPAEEVAYVIGCADGDAIQANTWYWSQIRTAKGDANTDKAKLFGQLGHRSPSWCYTTWCVFADQTEPIVGSWSNPWAISVPVDLRWTR